MGKTKILLVYPNPSVASPQMSPPLSILHVGEALKQAKERGKSDEAYEVRYFDERYESNPDLSWPDVVGVSSMTGIQLRGAIHWLKEAKRHGKRTILGGIHVTMQPEQCLAEDFVDSIVLSEGEWAVIEAIHGGYKSSHHRHLGGEHVSPVSPDTLYHFKRSALTGDTVLMTSRGCPFRCGFSVREDMPVATPSGDKFAKELVVGDVVLGWDEQKSEIATTQVVAIDYPEVTEEIELELEDGKVLSCSPDHPIMTQRGWVLAGNLTENDEILAQSD